MAVSITFVHGMMKVVNWSMGEYYMMGGYIQYLLITMLIGPSLWFLGIPIAFAIIFVLGVGDTAVYAAPDVCGRILAHG